MQKQLDHARWLLLMMDVPLITPYQLLYTLVFPYRLHPQCSDGVVWEGVSALQCDCDISIHGLTADRPILGTFDLDRK